MDSFELGAALIDKKRIIPVVTGDVDLVKIPMLVRQFQLLEESSPLEPPWFHGLPFVELHEAGMRVAEVIGTKH
jgi:hypothetical protein